MKQRTETEICAPQPVQVILPLPSNAPRTIVFVPVVPTNQLVPVQKTVFTTPVLKTDDTVVFTVQVPWAPALDVTIHGLVPVAPICPTAIICGATVFPNVYNCWTVTSPSVFAISPVPVFPAAPVVNVLAVGRINRNLLAAPIGAETLKFA